MVDDINFPKGRPPLTAAGRVKRVNPKKREDEKAPFEKFLDPEDQEEKKTKKVVRFLVLRKRMESWLGRSERQMARRV